MQATVRSSLEFLGIGLHSGRPVRMRILPASAYYGVWFKRLDVREADPLVPARWDAVVDSTLSTTLGNRDGVVVRTAEHVLAALYAAGVNNALVELDGPETPIMDGSALKFSEAISRAGLAPTRAEARCIQVLRPVEAVDGERSVRLEPADRAEFDVEIAYPDPVIGRQSLSYSLTAATFLSELADSRTFCREDDVATLRAAGYALGGALSNAVVVAGARVLNPDGLRRPDEFVRHKVLDAVGDLALAGAPILGRYVGRRPGHALNVALLRALFERPDAWRLAPMDVSTPIAA